MAALAKPAHRLLFECTRAHWLFVLVTEYALTLWIPDYSVRLHVMFIYRVLVGACMPLLHAALFNETRTRTRPERLHRRVK
jgi:hypothetical protein